MKPILDDALWEVVEPLLPTKRRRKKFPGRKRLDDRKVLTLAKEPFSIFAKAHDPQRWWAIVERYEVERGHKASPEWFCNVVEVARLNLEVPNLGHQGKNGFRNLRQIGVGGRRHSPRRCS